MLVDGSTPGNDMRYIERRWRLPATLPLSWNATRFVLMNSPDFERATQRGQAGHERQVVLTKLNQVAGAMTDNLDHYEMGLAAAASTAFIWDVYCDWFIEIAKPRLNSGDAEADTARRRAGVCAGQGLKLLHPFMPFITEAVRPCPAVSGEKHRSRAGPPRRGSQLGRREEAFRKVMTSLCVPEHRR